MTAALAPTEPRRNRGFDDTHREMIATAVRLIAESGVEALSIAALARAMGINRTTVYYHFDTREALIGAVKEWAAGELARGMDVGDSAHDRIGHISHFVLENPELIKLWIEDFVTGKDIRKSYSRWDEQLGHYRRYTVKQFRQHAAEAGFRVSWLNYWNSFTMPAAVAVRGWEKLFPKRTQPDFPAVSPFTNRALLTAAAAERWCLSHFGIPTGLSIAGVLQK